MNLGRDSVLRRGGSCVEQAESRKLLDDIQRVHRDNHGRYGSPRIHEEL